jgi:ABC-type multidrug transport system fused ATPase/permease subunit
MIDRKVPAQEEDAIVGSEVWEHEKTSTDIALNDPNAELAVDCNDISEEKKVVTKDDSHSASQLPSNRGHGSPQKRSWSTRPNPFKKRTVPPLPEHRGVSGEYRASFLSALYFQWMVPLMSVGYQRPLELTDIWNVNPDRNVEGLSDKFKSSLEKRRATPSKKLDPLTLALYDTFKSDFLVGGLCQLIAGCIQVLSPFVLKYLIYFVQDAYNAQFNGGVAPHIANGVGFVVGIACMQIVQSLCMNHYYYRAMILGGQVRSVLIACILDKAMKLSNRAKTGGAKDNEEGWSNGRINNLMSTDTSRIDSASVTIHRCWVAPIQLMLALALLCINLTYSALVGFGLICTVTPLLGRAVKSLMVRRRAINKLTDQRIQLTQETFNAIRIVKFFAWESKLLSRLAAIRNIEIQKIAYLLGIRNAILATAVVMPILASMLTFITYSLSNHVLDAAPIFSSLALFSALGIPLEILPVAVGRVVDGLASIRRISQFLNAQERQDDAIWNTQEVPAFTVGNASFVWEQAASRGGAVAPALEQKAEIKSNEVSGNSEPGSDAGSDGAENFREPFNIRDINLAVGRKELIAVIGAVGCGKSSLISALAGDMRKTSGSVTLGASRALCSQTPWIQNTTLRQNIIFGKEFDSSFYERVIDACALRPDIGMLPSGDLTEIGEKGVTISGGQKQRLNIARAIYFNADIVLMDDPLSAVDAHVGQHILDHAICGLLRDKCRVLVTHQLHVLHRADRIVWMKDGSIHKIATFPELMNDDLEFQKLMQTSSHKHEKTTEPEVAAEAQGKTISPPKLSNTVALMQEEERARGSVGLSAYVAFVRASGTILNFFVVLFVLVIAQGSNILTSLWLSWWTSNQFANFSTAQYIGVYAALGVVQAFLMFGYATILTTFSTKAAKNMLNSAISHTLRAPMLFFDTTPIGRVTNRFSKDVDTMDNRLTDNLRFLLYIIATVVSVFCLVIAYFYYFVIALIPLTVAFIFAASYYRASAREIKRHEAVLRTVVFAKFGEAITGTTTIRAYGVQSQFLSTIVQSLDSMNGAYFLTFAGQRWLSTRLDALGSLLIFVVGILIVTSRFDVKPSISGLVLSYMLSIVQLIQVIVQTYADVENDMNSVERLHYYSHGLEQEESVNTTPQTVRTTWPEKGELQFKDVQMRYRPGLPLVLKGLSVSIRSGERVGIVGRTGAGKTSIISAIFRLVELSNGSITIDGMNIAAVSLHDLRSRLSIIPQDPTLFQGTVRTNLDPLEEYEDSRLWEALRQAELVGDKVSTGDGQANTRISLDSPVEDEGLNYSLGQRQLLALARILIKDSQIIMIDEATSSVDFETDRKVQETILRAFRTRTLLCIAHRIKTIIG